MEPVPLPVAPALERVINKSDSNILQSAGIDVTEPVQISEQKTTQPVTENRAELLQKVENPEPTAVNMQTPLAFTAQKLATTVQNPMVKTEHAAENISKNTTTQSPGNQGEVKKPGYTVDPYRMLPE